MKKEADRKENVSVVTKEERKAAEEVISCIMSSPTAFHVINNLVNELKKAGFTELSESSAWKIREGGKYYVTRNGSSLIAFTIPKKDFRGFRVIASHSDSPTFKLKEAPELPEAGYLRLNVEGYGGMLCAPWFDRPLSVAGRVFLKGKKGGAIRESLFDLDRDLLMIPSLAIHMNREANEGYSYNKQKDMLPVFGEEEGGGRIAGLIAEAVGASEDSILGSDIFLYNRQSPSFWGEKEQFFSAPRLDDQTSVWCSLKGFFASENEEHVPVLCVFDNEEVGSGTRQGAGSTFLSDTLERIGLSLKRSPEQRFTAIAESMLISADNAHAVHPAHKDKADPVHRPGMNRGIVLKFSAKQSYTTDGQSAAVVRCVCEEAGIPCQTFVNRSDLQGGSTLGHIVSSSVPMKSADIGIAQLSMHSPYESAGVKDVLAMIRFSETFFGGNG